MELSQTSQAAEQYYKLNHLVFSRTHQQLTEIQITSCRIFRAKIQKTTVREERFRVVSWAVDVVGEGEQQGRRRPAKPSWRGSARGRWRGSTAPFLEVEDEEVQQVGIVVGERRWIGRLHQSPGALFSLSLLRSGSSARSPQSPASIWWWLSGGRQRGVGEQQVGDQGRQQGGTASDLLFFFLPSIPLFLPDSIWW